MKHKHNFRKKICGALIACILFTQLNVTAIVSADENTTNDDTAAQQGDDEQKESNIEYWDGSASLMFALGSGTKDDPYMISNGKDLKHFADRLASGENFNDAYISLNKDIYLNDISNYSQWDDNTAPSNVWQGMQGAFAGTFDGNGHTIYGMYIKSSDDNTGFFRATSKTREAVIRNVNFRNTYVSGQNNVACIVGRAFMLNCSNIVISGTVKGKNNVGGILGYYNSEHSGFIITGARLPLRIVQTMRILQQQVAMSVVLPGM